MRGRLSDGHRLRDNQPSLGVKESRGTFSIGLGSLLAEVARVWGRVWRNGSLDDVSEDMHLRRAAIGYLEGKGRSGAREGVVLSRESKRGCLSHDGGWARGRLGQKFSLVGKLNNSGEMRSHMKAHVKYFTDLREVTMVRTFPVGFNNNEIHGPSKTHGRFYFIHKVGKDIIQKTQRNA